MICQQCTCCDAQPDFTLCIFCEDGVPCPNANKKSQEATKKGLPVVSKARVAESQYRDASTSAVPGVVEGGDSVKAKLGRGSRQPRRIPPPPPPPATNGNGHTHETDPAQDAVTALVAQGFKVRAVNKTVAGVYQPGDSFDVVFKKSLDVLSGRSSPPEVSSVGRSRGSASRGGATYPGASPRPTLNSNPHPKPRKATRQMEKRQCEAAKYGKPACPNMIGPNNKSGVCSKHCYLPRMVKPGDKKKRKTPRAAEALSNGAPPQNNGHNGHATNGHAPVVSGRESPKVNVAISELQLDRLWVAMSVDEKARLMFPPAPSHEASNA